MSQSNVYGRHRPNRPCLTVESEAERVLGRGYLKIESGAAYCVGTVRSPTSYARSMSRGSRMRSRLRPGMILVGICLIAPAGMASCSRSSATERSASADRPQSPPASVDPTPLITLTGGAQDLQAVTPAPGSPLAGVDRDAGVSAQLRDGSTLWFFGDTAEFGFNNELKYFEVGSAAWSPPGQPTVTDDYAAGSRAVPFAAPTSEFPACPADSTASGMWPTAAVVEAVGSRDRVILWMANICLGPGPQARGRGMSVGEVWYDPADPHAGRPVTVTVLKQNLFDSPRYGVAAFLDNDGYVYTYGCDVPTQPSDPSAYGPCRSARVRPSDVAKSDAYIPWNGHEWSAEGEPGALDLRPASPDGVVIPPPGPFAVEPLGTTGLYVMVYSPWPGFTDKFEVRVARSPQGPWSSPALGHLDGCADSSVDRGGRCYAANTKPFLNQPGVLGIGYYDQIVHHHPEQGSFFVATVPYSIDEG